MSAALIKDIADIWFRLFDHRPFLSGEIKQFVKDYEETRKDKEVTKLLEIVENTSDIRDTKIDIILANQPKLDKINTLLDIANQHSVTTLETEQIYSVDRSLEAKRAERKLEWEKFMFEIDLKYKKIEETFSAKEQELTDFYKDLERKLHVK